MREKGDNSTEYSVIEKILKKKLFKLGVHNTYRLSWCYFNSNIVLVYVKGDVNKELWRILVKKILNEVFPLVFCKNKIFVSSVKVRLVLK